MVSAKKAVEEEVLKIVGQWRTPLTDVPKQEVGNARLVKQRYAKGHYHMEGIDGHLFWQAEKAITVTALQRRERGAAWKTWMVDDPLHWYAMRARVLQLPPGRILIAGLGLGLMLHHMVEREADFTSVTVVEIDRDVVRLIEPTLPDVWSLRARANFKIVEDDFYEELFRLSGACEECDGLGHLTAWPHVSCPTCAGTGKGGEAPDAILWDLAVGEGADLGSEFFKAHALCKGTFPDVPVYPFGLKHAAVW